MPDPQTFSRFLHEAPKAELHVHLRGAMPLPFFQERLRKYDPREAVASAPERQRAWFEKYENIRGFLNPSPHLADRAADLFRYTSFEQFLATFLFTSYFVRDAADFRGLVDAVLARLEAQNIVYAEITVSFIEYIARGIALDDIVAILDHAAQTSNKPRVQFIVDLVRNIGPGRALELLQEIVKKRPKSVIGLTLGGSEHLFPPAQFEKVYALASDAGLRRSIHAGEALGPESVWDAIRILNAERIGHGVRAIEDPELVRYLVEHQVPLEICPTSNLWTGIYASYDAHPLPALHRAGVIVTVSTDDPEFFATTMAAEYEHVHAMGVSEDEIMGLMRKACTSAFLPEQERADLAAQLQNFQFESGYGFPPTIGA